MCREGTWRRRVGNGSTRPRPGTGGGRVAGQGRAGARAPQLLTARLGQAAAGPDGGDGAAGGGGEEELEADPRHTAINMHINTNYVHTNMIATEGPFVDMASGPRNRW